MMNGSEKSDFAEVVGKPANGDEGSALESVERRAEAKGNTGKTCTRRTPSRESVLSGLERVRERARKGKKERFTALLRDLRAGVSRILVWISSRTRPARCAGCTGIRDYPYEGELYCGLRRPGLLRLGEPRVARPFPRTSDWRSTRDSPDTQLVEGWCGGRRRVGEWHRRSRRGVDVLLEQRGLRRTDFRYGERLAVRDHLVPWRELRSQPIDGDRRVGEDACVVDRRRCGVAGGAAAAGHQGGERHRR